MCIPFINNVQQCFATRVTQKVFRGSKGNRGISTETFLNTAQNSNMSREMLCEILSGNWQQWNKLRALITAFLFSDL